MSGSTYKMTTLVGESGESIEAAVRAAVATSASAVRGQTWANITDLRASLDGSGGVDQWQVKVEVAFAVEED